jgi:predicted AlkP superfamily pyrophosphatase or phosphodiesterase
MARPVTPLPLLFAVVGSLIALPVVDLDAARPPARHVVVIVCDGLRPDSVTQSDMPTLYGLAHRGTFFGRHHPVYLSSTEVNGTALATGAYPQHSGIIANNEYRPDVELLKPFGTEELEAVRKADALSEGHYLRMPTVAEIVRRAGYRSVVAGTKPVALLLDRSTRSVTNPTKDPVALFQGQGLTGIGDTPAPPDSTFPALADATRSSNRDQDTWTTRILIDRLWAGDIPSFTMLWLSEPDFAQHGSGPGSPVARAALKSDDDNIAQILKALDTAGARDSTDVLVVSDHGFSTIENTVDVAEVLKSAGFEATTKFAAPPENGRILVVPNGGSFSLYVVGHRQDVTSRLVQYLQQSDFAGVIFTRDPFPGAFSLAQVTASSPDAPDVLVSMRWNDRPSATETRGMLFSTATRYHAGQGYHASLSRFDMHNTLIASGPDFKTAFVDDLPSGNIDLAPTILALLGISQPQPMDGRVLSEALNAPSPAVPLQPATETLETTLQHNATRWTQYLRIARVGTTSYFDEGNGASSPVEAAAPSHVRDWTAAPAIAQVNTSHDVYALGDVHGDFKAMARVLASAHLIDSAARAPDQLQWTGGKAVLVCTGDFIDKWNHSLDVIAALRSLQSRAAAVGGRVIITMGNHEAEFLAGTKNSTDKKQVPKKKNLDLTGALFSDELKNAGISPADVRAGTDSQGIGAFLRNLPLAAKVNDFFFCHAGNTHGRSLAALGHELESQVDEKGFGAPILSDPDSMLEARMHPTPWWEAAKEKSASQSPESYLDSAVSALGARHLVFGHQPGKVEFADGSTRPKDAPFGKFGGLVFLIDTGMSRGADSARGAVLRFHRDGADHLTATALFSDGEAQTIRIADR